MSHILDSSISVQKSLCQQKKTRTPSLAGRIWTAARCQRLLQPLISGLEHLRQDSVGSTSPEIASGANENSTNSLLDSPHENSLGRKRCGDDDVNWRPANKRIRKTYSSRHKLKGEGFTNGYLIPRAPRNSQARKPILQPGEVIVSTPFLCRAKAMTIDLSQEPVLDTTLVESLETELPSLSELSDKTRDVEAHFRLAESMRHIRDITHIARYNVYEDIYNAFDALLGATSPAKDRVNPSTTNKKHDDGSRSPFASGTAHSRSLFAICLRNVPEYIQHEETRNMADAEQMDADSALDKRSVSAEIYSSLESLGTSGSGWRHLRMVVRAHSVLVVKDAILQGLMDTNFASVLVMLCVQKSALGEAEKLLTALLTTSQYPNPISTSSKLHENPLLQPLLVLEDLTAKTGRVGHYFRQLTELLTRRLLPLTWLATKALSSVWTTMFRMLSDDPTNQDAMVFITSILPMICTSHPLSASQGAGKSMIQGEMLSALYNTLRSILVTLSAMCLLNSAYKKSITSLAEHILADNSVLSPEFDHDRIALVAVTQLFADCGVLKNSDLPVSLLEVLCRHPCGFSASRCVKEDLPAFVCDVAHCLARGTSNKPFEHLKILIGHMEASASTDTAEVGPVLHQIIRDCAFTFAQHQPEQEQEHFKYAQQFGRRWLLIEAKASVGVSQSPCNAMFRWEEGISEWVTATPATKLGKARGTKGASCSDKVKSPPKMISKRKEQVPKHTRVYRFLGSPRLLHNSVSELDPPALPSPRDGIESTTIPLQQWDTQSANVECLRLSSPPQLSLDFSRYRQPKRGVNKLQRLGHELLRSNQSWKSFSNSDDELTIPNPGTFHRSPGKLVGRKESIRRKRRADRRIDRSSMSLDITLRGEIADELGF